MTSLTSLAKNVPSILEQKYSGNSQDPFFTIHHNVVVRSTVIRCLNGVVGLLFF